MPEGSDEQKTPSRSWRSNADEARLELPRQSFLRTVQQNAGMNPGRARGQAVGVDPGGDRNPYARRDLHPPLEVLEINVNPHFAHNSRRIHSRYNALSPIFHASTPDLSSPENEEEVVDRLFRRVTIEIVDSPSEHLVPTRGKKDLSESDSSATEDRPFEPYSSDSDSSDSDYEKPIKLSHDTNPKTSQGSRHTGLELEDFNCSVLSTAKQRGSPTFKRLVQVDVDTLEADQSVTSAESDYDLSETDLFHTDSSDEWDVDVRESNRRSPFRFQSVYYQPQNSEEEDQVEILYVDVGDTQNCNVDDIGHKSEHCNESVTKKHDEPILRVQRETKHIEMLEGEFYSYAVGEYLKTIEEADESEEEVEQVDEDNDEHEVHGEKYGDEAEIEEQKKEPSLDVEGTEESLEEEEYDEHSLSYGENYSSLQDKRQCIYSEEFDFNYDDDDTIIEYEDVDEIEDHRSFNEEEDLTTEENQCINEEIDQSVSEK